MLHSRVMHRKILTAGLVIIALGLAAYFALSRSERTFSPAASSPVVLPGAEEFGLTKAELVQKIEATEAAIAACMRQTGFQYVPVDYLTVRKSMDADKKAAGLTDEEFRQQFGYGISTRSLSGSTPPQLSGADHAATIGLGLQNVDFFTSLAPTDQAAYNHALLGENPTTTFAVSLEAEDFSTTGGCTRTAVEQVFADEDLRPAYVNPGDALLAQDQRVITATAKWASCMREAGFEYNNPEEIEPTLRDRLQAITGRAELVTASPDTQEALTELQGEERAIAVSDAQCEEEFIEPAVKQVETELYGAPQN